MDTSAMRELKYLANRAAVVRDPESHAERLYSAIGREVTDVEHLRLRAEATNAAVLAELRGEVRAYQALVRCLMSYAGDNLDSEHMKRVHATIARFNLGEMFRPGGGADRYLIPYELTGGEARG